MRSLLLALLVATATPFLSLRGYSTVWKNHRNEVVKRVTYIDRSTRFGPKFTNETEMLNDLPPGEYEAFAIPAVQKLLYYKKRRLGEKN